MSRSRANQDWDPMQEEFDNSTYDAQYPDDGASGGVQLNHNCLYVTNIPKGLTREGIRAAFARFGTLVRVYLSLDPFKRYALVTFETASEAKLAMMKMNQTEPLKLNINISHSKKKENYTSHDSGERRQNTQRDRGSHRDESGSVASYGRQNRSYGNQEEMMNADEDLEEDCSEDLGLDTGMDPHIGLELERLKLEHLKLQEKQNQCKQRMLLLHSKKTIPSSMGQHTNRSILPDGTIVVRNNFDKTTDSDNIGSGAGDSERDTVCSCKPKVEWWEAPSSSDDGTSTPSTCVLCSEDRSDTRTEEEYQVKSERTSRTDRTDTRKSHTRTDSKFDVKFTNVTTKSVASKVTDLTSKKSEYSKTTENVSKVSDVTSKRVGIRRLAKRSEGTCEFKYSDLYSDSDEEVDETNRLIELRGTDYSDIVEDHLRVIVALAGYPKSKMRLQQMEVFQKSLNDVMDMQLKAGLLKKMPTFLDYYLSRGAIVCICKDLETRDWIVRISPGLQERMANNLILLRAKVKRLCLAVLKIPHTCWPTTAQDAFKLLQYFNPTLRTNLWRIYAQKTVRNVECTSFLLDRVSGEIVRGPSFKNIIDYNQMEFELTGYSEIYYECFLSDMDEDLRSVASRVKLLEEIRSNESTPRNTVTIENETMTIGTTKKDEQEKDKEDTESADVQIEDIETTSLPDETEFVEHETNIEDVKKDLDNSLQKDILRKLKDVKYISENDEVIVWNEETTLQESEVEMDINKEFKSSNADTDLNEADRKNDVSKSSYIVSENAESIYESNDNLMSRNSNVNICSNRGMAYYRRTNYLHVENELKTAITLDGYPQNKLEGTHIRRLKQLFKEYIHKDMKSQRFANLIIPKFQDVYLSNGAVIYICDSLETRDYLGEVLPKLINATGLKLVFRDVKDLVRYTRIVMRLPEKLAHVESVEILLKLQLLYPSLKPDCWKYYSDVAGKQKRQFGVDPESLEVIRSPDFDPVYEGEKISFRIIDRQKRDVSFDETTTKDNIETNAEEKKFKDKVLRTMYCPIDQEIMNAPLTRIRTNHYTDLIPDDLKLYVGPSNYPETRIDEQLFHTIKRTIENVVLDTTNEANFNTIPKIHDIYLFDGVIFIICKDMASRRWIEASLTTVNSKLQINLKATEFRGAVGIISMALKTDKDTDEVIDILQTQNPRLRTKFWRKISTVRCKNKLDVVLQIDKLSAQVINGKDFNRMVANNVVQFTLGHLQSLLKPKASLEEICKRRDKKTKEKPKPTVASQGTDAENLEVLNKNNVQNKMDDFKQVRNNKDAYYSPTDLDPKIINSDSPKSVDNLTYNFENQYNYCKMILKIPHSILPENKDDLNIIFDLLEDKNPGLNTELWQVLSDSQYTKGKFTVLIDRQSASVIKGKLFDPTLAGEKLKILLQRT
ncbi:uncharacterized protein [Epargyreus clarus]|uniref:uncharacterized protein isoform X2 n=1 Tax=Epargyreus clarus TaxID=520877 RepID=UPI003C2E79C7